ncbi:MAG: hypothetical protein JO253_00345, partial [Alphaproteobacteria bacterium]|nr:hypothetical protein [Alphaproteobacteria bacterium]
DKAKSRKSSDTPDAGTGDDSTQSGAPASTAPAITVPGPQPLSALGLAVQSQFVDQPYINFTDANKARLAFDKDGPFLNYDVNGANDAQHSGTVRLQPGQKVTLANGDTLTADSAGIVTVTHGNATAKIGYDADKRAIVDSSAVPKGGPAPQSAAPAAAAPDAAADGTPKPDAAAAPAPAAAGDDVFANMDLSRPPRQQLGAATAAGVPAPQEKRVAPPAAVTPPPPAKRASQVQINWN